MSMEELLASLQAQYLASLPGKITLIETQIQSAPLEELRESFHKLKGTGRTYGLPEVSQLAEVVEEVCLEKPSNAKEAAREALVLLREIHEKRQRQEALNCTLDPRFQKIQKLLQKS